MNIVFLDVDGVLNSENYLIYMYEKNKRPYHLYDMPFDPKCMENLKRLVKETKSKIVISSTWRKYEKNMEKLPNAYKSVFFILQNIHFLKTGDFIQTKQELLSRLAGEDREVLAWAMKIKNQNTYDFDEAFQTVFEWSKNTIGKS